MTLEEIAKEIGVSKSTVSRALSGKGRIGEKTRNRILEVAKRGEEREEMARTQMCIRDSFFFSYNGIFGIEEVILQNIWQNTQEKIRNIKRERENRKR